MPDIKRLFSSPKKAAVTLACAGVILVTLGICIVVYAAGGPDQSHAIGGERARNSAYADAGVDPVDAREVSVEYERFQDGFVYEVEFTAGDTEYEYKIDAEDGSVVKRESKTVRRLDDGSPAVTMEEAQAIAFADAGVAQGQADVTGAEPGTEQGMPVYKISFRAGGSEYTYEINAQTGSVYSKRTVVYVGPEPSGTPDPTQTAAPAQSPAPDPQAGQPPAASTPPSTPAPQPTQQPSSQAYLDLDAAKRAALADAGVDASQVTFTKARMDREDGVMVYEVEFCTSIHEHEYEINAQTGAICSHSVEACTHHSSGHHSSGHHDEPQSSAAVLIGADAAKSAALAHANCPADEVTFTKAELDYDNGRAVYEIEFRKGRAEYEYEIDAATGAVLEYDWDLD